MTAIHDAASIARTGFAAPFTTITSRASATAGPSRALERRHSWERRYRWILRTSDAAAVVITCAIATVVSTGVAGGPLAAGDPGLVGQIALVTAVVWLLMLSLFATRDVKLIGSGAAEYTRLVHATGFAFGLLAMLDVALDVDGIRSQLFVALPLGVSVLLVERWLWRRWLIRRRATGAYTSRAMVVGDRADVEYVIRTIADPGLGYQVVGASLRGDELDSLRVDDATYPVLRTHTVAEAAAALDADTIIVASGGDRDPDDIKHLAWQLENTAAELVISSRLSDVAGPRMSLRPIEGLPLIHVEIASFAGRAYLAKRALDIVVSATALLLFAPVAAVIALAIRLDSPGPLLFPQARVGRDGHEFRMIKFRSMTVDAEERRAALLAANEGAGPLFKMHDDPRVTRVGRILRKYSLDEVPQFWNVLVGDMSVVGPRPPLPSEVATYDDDVLRRLYIKPGITGPWQVGGRSDLSWEESVRLDLRYVENWTVMTDLVLMWRTVRVMLRPDGAY